MKVATAKDNKGLEKSAKTVINAVGSSTDSFSENQIFFIAPKAA